MNKSIITLIFALFSLTANAEDLTDARKNIGTSLNTSVKEIKGYLKDVEDKLKTDNASIKEVYKSAKLLKENSKEVELNPTVLSHGKDKTLDCRDRKELIWDGKKWICQEPLYKSDCIEANDEYRYENPEGSGNFVCKKIPKGESIEYKWEFRANSNDCHSNTYRRKVYRCYYTNKNGQEIDVEESYCGKSSDLTSENGKQCTSSWEIGSWGGCDKTCGTGTQTRSVTCKDNHFCPGVKPATSQVCNTQACPIAWSTGSWGQCKSVQTCRWGGSWKEGRERVCTISHYEQTRSVYCQAGFTCSGAKPAATQRCTPPEKHCGKRCEG